MAAFCSALTIVGILMQSFSANAFSLEELTQSLDDVSLVISPSNNSQLHYITNDSNETSSILAFNTELTLPPLPPANDYKHFLCFQLWLQDYNDTNNPNYTLNLRNESELKCQQTIPRHPFNITNLSNGTYHIKTSVLLASQSNLTDIIMLKQEVTVFHVKAMVDFHATYEWQSIASYHSILNGLDIQMDMQTNSKLVKIPNQWVLQLFISPRYRLLWLLVSRSTTLAAIKYEVARHTGIDYGCIDIVQHDKVIQNEYETVESLDWFYAKYDTSIAIHPSLFCVPKQCGLGYLNAKQNASQGIEQDARNCAECEYVTIWYKQMYARNKGKMWIDISNPMDSLPTLPS